MDPHFIALAVSACLNIAVPVALVVVVRRRFDVSWRVIFYGALVFLVFQVITRMPAIVLLQYITQEWINASNSNRVIFMLFAALTAGIFEECGRWIGYRYWIPQHRRWEDGVGFGVGHGGFEAAFLIGGMQLLSLVPLYLLLFIDYHSLFPQIAEQLDTAKDTILQVEWHTYLWSVFERICALVIQISLSLLVLTAFVKKNIGYLFWAIGYHTIVDLSPLVLHFTESNFLTEMVVLVLALFSARIIKNQISSIQSELQGQDNVPIM